MTQNFNVYMQKWKRKKIGEILTNKSKEPEFAIPRYNQSYSVCIPFIRL